MNYVNYDNVISTLISHGFVLSSLDIGVMKRVKRDGHSQKGWYVVHAITLDDGRSALIGSFGYWFGSEKFSEKIAPGKEFALSKDQLAAIKKQHAEALRKAAAKRKQEAEQAAKQASNAWYQYIPEGESSYLQRKGVQAHGVKFSPSGNGTFAVPMMDTLGRVHGLQIIRGKNRGAKLEKQYWPKGLDKVGHFHTIGALNRSTRVVLIAEGYATAATLHQATGLAVLVAFDAGNLLPVAEAIHKKYPRLKILLCADDDYLTDGNPGCKKAEAAAIAVGGAWVAPTFPHDRNLEKLTDFNDLAHFNGCGEVTVAEQISNKLFELGWDKAAFDPSAVADIQQGGGGKRGTLKSLLEVEEAVQRYSLIYGAGGTMYDHEEYALIPKSDVLDICVDHAFRDMKRHPLWSVVRLSEVGFDPTGKDKNIVCNLWGGWPTKPKQGSCELLLDLLRYLCSGEEAQNSSEIYEWVLKWLAYPIQHPGAKMKTALVLHGGQGAGKNLFFEAYAEIFGKYSRIVGQSEIDDKFNDWASGKLFMIADEVVARQELFHIKNKLKALITGEWIRINPKNVAAHDERNHVNLVFLSNERQPLVLERDDRRFAVIWTPQHLDQSFYKQVGDERDNGGVEALHDYLLKLDLSGFNEHSKPPVTKSKQELIDINLDSSESFISDWTDGLLDYPVCPVVSEDLYQAYMRYCKSNGVRFPRELRQVVGNIVKMDGWRKGRMRLWDNFNHTGERKQRTVIVPNKELITPSKAFAHGNDMNQWISDCCLDFSEALGGDHA